MTSNLKCLLCGSHASYEVVHNPYGKRVSCPTCTEYFIDPSSEQHIEGMAEVTRSEAKAKLSKGATESGPGHLYVIRAPRDEERGAGQEGVATLKMIAEWVPTT